MTAITGKDLITWGFRPGPWFADAIKAANDAIASGSTLEHVQKVVEQMAPPDRVQMPLRSKADAPTAHINLIAEGEDEETNLNLVMQAMDGLMRVPTIKSGAVMPDACPAGTIPVGAIVAAENGIHPGFHSSDICCSLAITVVGKQDPKRVLDVAFSATHFGPGGRKPGAQITPPAYVTQQMDFNPFFKGMESEIIEHFGTQGDGNHFLFVGTMKSTGETAIVTHHGSRKPGALLYKRGLTVAEKIRRDLSPETPKGAAWIPADSLEGEDYWNALQAIRLWTKENHFAIHDAICEKIGGKRSNRWWNEHNFVFQRSDGLFYHAKGATPSFDDFSPDDSGLTLIPMNMAEPILVTRHVDQPHGLGFAPHGAGRNLSRTAYMRRNEHLTDEQMLEMQTGGIDARFFCGIPDPSELPGAYKSAASVRDQISHFELAEIVDEVIPYGSIMAGDWQRPFRERRASKGEKG